MGDGKEPSRLKEQGAVGKGMRTPGGMGGREILFHLMAPSRGEPAGSEQEGASRLVYKAPACHTQSQGVAFWAFGNYPGVFSGQRLSSVSILERSLQAAGQRGRDCPVMGLQGSQFSPPLPPRLSVPSPRPPRSGSSGELNNEAMSGRGVRETACQGGQHGWRREGGKWWRASTQI